LDTRVLIWGAGAIGGTLGAYLARAGETVLLVDQDEAHVEAMQAHGIEIEGPVEAFRQRVEACLPGDVPAGPFGRCFLAVKAHHTDGAIRQLEPHLAADGWVVSAQNGLNELAIGQVIGADRTIGCFVNFGADWQAPGRILLGNRGTVAVGELDGSNSARLDEALRLLRIFEPDAVATPNIWGYLWGKLGYGAMLFATALTDATMSECFDSAPHERVWIRLGREVMAVAEAHGARPLGFNGFDPVAFGAAGDEAACRASIAAMAEFNRPSAKPRSGIWRDLAVRRRRTEVDAQVAVVATLGTERGIETPVLRALVALIHGLEEGRIERGWATLDRLAEEC